MPAKSSKSLFSQHYLTHRLLEHEEWSDLKATEAYQTAVSLYHSKQEVLPQLNEAQTEQEFIQPMLEQVLGFDTAYSVQTAVAEQSRQQLLDAVLAQAV